jgi:nucleoside-diphosphate-sugar epimerase
LAGITAVRRRVIVFGASSYVGTSAVRSLLAAEYEVVAVSRRPATASIVFGDLADRVAFASIDEATEGIGDAFAVLNLAYVKETKMEEAYRANRDLVDAVVAAAVSSGAGRIIHTSTLAVFGYDLGVRVQPASVRWHPEDPYVETKTLAEHRLVDATSKAGKKLAIVRLGNVIGPGSPAWVAGLAQRTLEGRPVAYEGRDGFSNATYVDNVADYLRFLVAEPGAILDAFGAYHHLAEFSSHRWGELREAIAAATGAGRDVVVESAAGSEGSDGSTVQALRSRARRGRTGGYLRAFFGAASRSRWVREAVARGRASVWEVTRPMPLTADDEAFLRIMSVTREFRSHVIASWQPPVSFERAIAEIEEWLGSAGYSLRRDRHPVADAP